MAISPTCFKPWSFEFNVNITKSWTTLFIPSIDKVSEKSNTKGKKIETGKEIVSARETGERCNFSKTSKNNEMREAKENLKFSTFTYCVVYTLFLIVLGLPKQFHVKTKNKKFMHVECLF